MRSGQELSALSKLVGARASSKVASRSMQINIAKRTQRADRTVNKFYGDVPVEGSWIENRRSRLNGSADLTM